MNTIPAAEVSETPLLQRDVKINAKTLVGGAALAAFVLGALAATAVNPQAPVRSTAFWTSDPGIHPSAALLDPSQLAQMASGIEYYLWGKPKTSKIVAANGWELDMPTDVFSYDSDDNTFAWRLPPFGGGGDDHTAIYNFDTSLADQGLYKLWRDGAGGYYTVELAPFPGPYFLTFTCRANNSWDDLSDQC